MRVSVSLFGYAYLVKKNRRGRYIFGYMDLVAYFTLKDYKAFLQIQILFNWLFSFESYWIFKQGKLNTSVQGNIFFM